MGAVMGKFDTALRALEQLDAQALIEQSKAVQRAQRRLAAMEQEEAKAQSSAFKYASAVGGMGMGGAGGGHSVSFKEVVEAFALRHSVSFAPRSGRLFEGKQLWQFGACLCYFDNSVVFVSNSQNSKRRAEGGQGGQGGQGESAGARELLGWAPVGLEELLARSNA
jgi:hypothetical protein